MAMIDYGAVVIKNGKVINKNMFFMNMLEAVGWVDKRRIRHEDCDVFTDPDLMIAQSNCDIVVVRSFVFLMTVRKSPLKIAMENLCPIRHRT